MTTTVKIKPSSHDVEVFLIDPKTGNPVSVIDDETAKIPYKLLPKDALETVFYAHSGQDIIIREVKD